MGGLAACPVESDTLRTMRILPAALLLALASCKQEHAPTGAGIAATGATGNAPGAGIARTLPADGKYEHVTVEGREVPMIQVMNGGAVVLVDTDGKKPRTWEEQFKRKGNLPDGTYNLHKTNVNGNDTFEDDPIDREGTWTIDGKGNITRK